MQNLNFVALPVPEIIVIGVLGGVQRDIAAFVLQHTIFPTPPLASQNFPMFPWE